MMRPLPPRSVARPASAYRFAGVIYGPSGVGKSSLAANFPNTVFVIDSAERGIHDLIEFNQCPSPLDIKEADGWKHLLNISDKLCSQKGVEHVVFDSLYGMEQLCFRYHCKQYYDDDWTANGFYSYQQGPKNAAKKDWPDLITAWENLRMAGKNVLILGHSQIKSFSNPDGPDYDRFILQLDKESWAAVHRWAPMVLFYRFHVDVKKDGPRNKAKSDSEKRLICTVHSALYDAKNRYGLPPVIVVGSSGGEAYQAFTSAFEKARP